MNILNLPYSVLISVIVGITNMIPYFGPYIGAVPGIIILTVTGFKYGIVFAIMILALQQFDGLILGPRLLGDSTGLRRKTSQTGSGNKSAGIINLTTLSQRKARCRGKDAMPVFYHHKVNRCVHGRFRYDISCENRL